MSKQGNISFFTTAKLFAKFVASPTPKVKPKGGSEKPAGHFVTIEGHVVFFPDGAIKDAAHAHDLAKRAGMSDHGAKALAKAHTEGRITTTSHLAYRSGPVADALSRAAGRLAQGGNSSEIKAKLYEEVHQAVAQTLGKSVEAHGAADVTKEPEDKHTISMFTAGKLFTRFVAEFANKKPLETPNPNRTDGHWITEQGAHVFVDGAGNHFAPGRHPLDKTHRNVTVPVHPKLFTRLDIDPAEVKADYVKLDQKHQDQFPGPDDVKRHVEYVMAAPTHVLPGGSDHSSEPGHVLLVRKNGGDKAAVLDMVLSGARPDSQKPGKMFGGRYNIRSAYTLNAGRLALKIANAPSGWSADFSTEGKVLEISQGGGTRWRIGPSSPASKTLREEELHPTIRRQLCLGPTVPSDTDSTGSSVIPCRSESSSAGGSHTSIPASGTLRPNSKVARRPRSLGGTVPLDTGSADTSIISLPFVAFSLYARFLKEQDSKKPTKKAIEEARRQHVNESDSFCPDCGAVYEWSSAEDRGRDQGSCNQCGSHNPPVDGKLALEEADFFADFSTADFASGAFVNVPALLSRTGNYADKGISLTADDFDRAAKTVSVTTPVKMNMAHLRRGSVLDDAGLGEIHKAWRQGQELWGEIAVPQWLASLARERGLKLPVSAEWDIKTKTLRGCAWERTPRIEDARAVL